MSPSRDSASFVARIKCLGSSFRSLKNLSFWRKKLVSGLEFLIKLEVYTRKVSVKRKIDYCKPIGQLLTDFPILWLVTLNNCMPESLPILLLKLCNILWFRSDLISLFYRHLKGALYIIDTQSLQIFLGKVRKVNIDFPWSLSCLTQNSAKNLELSRSSNFSV